MKELKKEIIKKSEKKEKITFIDVHCHLDLCEDIELAMKNAKRKKVGIIVSNGINPSNNKKVIELADRYGKTVLELLWAFILLTLFL